MRIPLEIIWGLWIATAAAAIAAPPPKGSNLAPEENLCAQCHGEEAIWDGPKRRLFISQDSLAEDVHRKAGVNCHDCHGGDPSSFDTPEAHAQSNGFRSLDQMEAACDRCHHDQWIEVQRKGVHAKAGAKDATGRGTPMKCTQCHGAKVHGMLPVDDSRSPVFLDHQVELCGGCHEEERKTYEQSTHGHGLRESGLLVTAVCSDCHGAHGIYRAADRRSTLHTTKIAATCGKCHTFIEERLEQSVHGRGNGPGAEADRAAPGGKRKRKPSCTDCHQRHDLPHPKSVQFRLRLPSRCGNCHTDRYDVYGMTLHGELTELGFSPAAKCSDCHGAHDVLPSSDPRSHLAPANRLATCRKCHIYAVAGFCEFDPHADYKDATHYPRLSAVYHGIKTPLNLALGLFLIHAVLWFLRSFIHTFIHGRHRILTADQEVAFIRFQPIHRMIYAIMLVSFLGLTLTGMPLKFGAQPWARALARSMGGFETTSVWHRTFAVLAITGLVLHLVGAVKGLLQRRRNKVPWRTLLFGPDSPLPGPRDVRDIFGMVRWFLGLGPKPTFERWTYWEKFDYWAVAAGAVLIGGSGLVLWYPNVFCTILPGGILNVAKMVHSELALLIALSLFVIHLFNTHLRPEKFPMDLSVVTGLVSEEHLRMARPEYLKRIRETGELDQVLRKVPSRRQVRFVALATLLVFVLGLSLLGLVVVANLGK